MDEGRRFLRFVIPGVIYLLSTILFTWILFPSWVLTQLAVLLREQVGVGSAIAGVVASGGVGYIFSVIHHLIHNHVRWLAPIDYSAVLNRLVSTGQISILSISEGEKRTSAREFTRNDALPVLTSLWHERSKSCAIVSGVESRLNSFHDTAHASGTARIAVGAALITTVLIAGEISQFEPAWPSVLRFALMSGVAVAAGALFWEDYYRVGNLAQRMLDEVLSDAIAKEMSDREGRAVETIVIR